MEAVVPHDSRVGGRSIGTLLAIALGAAGAAALANNLPVSVAAQTVVGAGPAVYALAVGLSVGALAAPQGSVATLIARNLAGSHAPVLSVRSQVRP